MCYLRTLRRDFRWFMVKRIAMPLLVFIQIGEYYLIFVKPNTPYGVL